MLATGIVGEVDIPPFEANGMIDGILPQVVYMLLLC